MVPAHVLSLLKLYYTCFSLLLPQAQPGPFAWNLQQLYDSCTAVRHTQAGSPAYRTSTLQLGENVYALVWQDPGIHHGNLVPTSRAQRLFGRLDTQDSCFGKVACF